MTRRKRDRHPDVEAEAPAPPARLLRPEPPSERTPKDAPAWYTRRFGGDTIAHVSEDAHGQLRLSRYGRSEAIRDNGRDDVDHIAKPGRPARGIPDDERTARNRASTKALTLQLGSAVTPQRVGGIRSGQARREGGKAGAILAAAASLPAKTKPRDVKRLAHEKLAKQGVTVSLRHVRRVLK